MTTVMGQADWRTYTDFLQAWNYAAKLPKHVITVCKGLDGAAEEKEEKTSPRSDEEQNEQDFLVRVLGTAPKFVY